MNFRKTHPYDTISISLNATDLKCLLDGGLIKEPYLGRVRIALTEDAKNALIERETALIDTGLTDNQEYQALTGDVHYAINVIGETMADYERLAKELADKDKLTAFEFAYKADGLREALGHLKNILAKEE